MGSAADPQSLSPPGLAPPPLPHRPVPAFCSGTASLQDACHLLVQILQGLQQARQHELVVVLVVQLRGPHTQDVAVVVGEELPQAPDVLVFGLVSILVWQVGGEGWEWE